MKDKEFMLDFADGKASFINEVQVSNNVKFEKRDKYLYCDNAILGHEGVGKYYDHELGGITNKIVKIHRFADDLLDVDSINTIIGKPITVMHPRDNNGKIKFVDGTNFKEYEIGTVLDAWKDGNTIKGKLVIKDPQAIVDVLDGKLKSLSLGYNAKVEAYGDGDYKQTNFYFNHLALVPKGRQINAQIVDEDVVGKEKPMSLWSKLKNALTSGEAQINEEQDVLEFADEKHTTKRFRVEEIIDEYDDETGESKTETVVKETVTHEHERNKDKLPNVLGDEDTTEKEDENLENEEVKVEPKEDEKPKIGDEDTVVQEDTVEGDKDEKTETEELENKEDKGKDFGDEDMTKEQLEALKAELRTDLLKEIKESGKDAFGDLNPLDNQGEEQPKGYQLDFERDEALRKEMYSRATDPTRHDGDFVALSNARKQLFK